MRLIFFNLLSSMRNNLSIKLIYFGILSIHTYLLYINKTHLKSILKMVKNFIVFFYDILGFKITNFSIKNG